MLNPGDIKIDTYCSGSSWAPSRAIGVKLTHLPTGITTYCDTNRSQHSNKWEAWKMMEVAIKTQCGDQMELFE